MEVVPVVLVFGLVFGNTRALQTGQTPSVTADDSTVTFPITTLFARSDLPQLRNKVKDTALNGKERLTAKPALLFSSASETTTEAAARSTITRSTSLASSHTTHATSVKATLTSERATASGIAEGTTVTSQATKETSTTLLTTALNITPNKDLDGLTSPAHTTKTTTQEVPDVLTTRNALDVTTVKVSPASLYPRPTRPTPLPLGNLTVTLTSQSLLSGTTTTLSNLTKTSTSQSLSSKTTTTISNQTIISTSHCLSSDSTPFLSSPTVMSTSPSSPRETASSTMMTTGTQTEHMNVTVQTAVPTGLGGSTVEVTTTNVTAVPSTMAENDHDERPASGQKKSGFSRDAIIATSICVAVLVMALVVLGLWFYNVKWKLHRRDGPLLRDPDSQGVTGKSYSTVQYYNDGADNIKLRDV